jgi:hypothetical protein
MTGNTLNSVERIPPEILAPLGRQLDCTPPQIATIRAFYTPLTSKSENPRVR